MGKKSLTVDLAVIGAGPGGAAAACTAAEGGSKTLLIEPSDPGGTCLNRGCVPTKTWIAARHLGKGVLWGEKIGIQPTKPDFPKLQVHMREVVGLVRKGLASTLKKTGVELLSGTAQFLSPKELAVNDGETVVSFKSVVIAAGSRPLDLFGAGPGLYDSDSIFSLESLPASLAIVGGGAIGLEMASFFRGMGCEVTLIEAMPDIIPLADADIRSVVRRELKKQGVTVMSGARIKSVSPGPVCVVRMEDGSEVSSEVVLTAAGRRPNSDGIGLDKAGVRTDVRGFIEVDGTMGTSREGIYAVGDIAGKALLAYTAHHEGVTAARNILGLPCHMDYRFVPSVVFSDPETAWVGPTEEALGRRGVRFRVGRYHVRALARAHACGEIAGMAKVIVGEDDALLAVHLVSPMATELIHCAVTAMASGMKASRLAEVPFGHPTFSEIVSLAAADALSRPV